MLILLRGPRLLGVRIQTGLNELYLAIVSPHVNRQSKTVLDSGFRATDSGIPDIFACGIQNPGLWNPGCSLRNLQSN